MAHVLNTLRDGDVLDLDGTEMMLFRDVTISASNVCVSNGTLRVAVSGAHHLTVTGSGVEFHTVILSQVTPLTAAQTVSGGVVEIKDMGDVAVAPPALPPMSPMLTVQHEGAHLVLHKCTIQGGHVAVLQGARLSMCDCNVCSVYCSGQGSRVAAHGCKVLGEDNGLTVAGYAEALLVDTTCSGAGPGASAALVQGLGSRLWATSSQFCGSHTGLHVSGGGTVQLLGACKATRNTGCGALVVDGGRFGAQDGCLFSDNGRCGVLVHGKTSCLRLSDKCCSSSNAGQGVRAQNGGRALLETCVLSSNRADGVYVSDHAILKASLCDMSNNVRDGLRNKDGWVWLEGCKLTANGGRGVLQAVGGLFCGGAVGDGDDEVLCHMDGNKMAGLLLHRGTFNMHRCSVDGRVVSGSYTTKFYKFYKF